MRWGASRKPRKRKKRETLPSENPQPRAMAAAPCFSAALAEFGDGIGLVRLAGGSGRRPARGVA